MNADEQRAYARRLVADWPPLTPEKRARLSALLRPIAPVRLDARKAAEGAPTAAAPAA